MFFFVFFTPFVLTISTSCNHTHTHNDLQKSKYGLKQLDEWKKKTGSESHMVIDKQLTHHETFNIDTDHTAMAVKDVKKTD